LVMSEPTASNPLNVCGVVVASCIRNAPYNEYRIYAELHPSRKLHPASYRGCSHAKGHLQRRRAQRAPKESSGRTFCSKFTSPQQS
jgi:hypothetical protein